MSLTKWVIWYVDDTVRPVCALADSRETAIQIGEKARSDEDVIAVVSENEGGHIPTDKKKLSTLNNPKRFITAFLQAEPQNQGSIQNRDRNTTASDVTENETESVIKSDTTATDILGTNDLR